MSPTEVALSYRKRAAKCVSIAQKLEPVSQRLALIERAEELIAVAQHAEMTLQASARTLVDE